MNIFIFIGQMDYMQNALTFSEKNENISIIPVLQNHKKKIGT